MLICGIDEVGRGPMCGPVVACAVILKDEFDVSILNDSKKLSESKRFSIEEQLLPNGVVCYGIGCVSNIDIDKINIHKASLLAMKRAYEKMLKNTDIKPDEIYVDGKYVPDIKNIPMQAVIKGDSKIHQIMASSIIAKNYRDRLMVELSKIYPQYMLQKHKGYLTKLHRELIDKYGYGKIYRKSFKLHS